MTVNANSTDATARLVRDGQSDEDRLRVAIGVVDMIELVFPNGPPDGRQTGVFAPNNSPLLGQ